MSHRAQPSSDFSDRNLHAQTRQLLRALIARTLVFFAEREAEGLRRVRANLLQLLDTRPSPLQSQNLRSAYMLLERRTDTFNSAFRTAIQTIIDKEAGEAFPDAASHPTQTKDIPTNPLDGMSLTLVDMSEVDRIMLIDRVALRFNQHYELTLMPLTERLSALLNLSSPSLSRNPFRPEIFIRAFLQAWEKGGFDPQATDDLLLSLQPQNAIDLGALYLELNTTLAAAGVAAKPELRIKPLAADQTAPTTETPAQVPAPSPVPHQPAPRQPHATDATPRTAAAGDVSPWAGLSSVGRNVAAQARQFLQRLGWVADSTAASSMTAQAVIPADSEFMGYLGDLQASAMAFSSHPMIEGQNPADHNVLRQMRNLEQVRRAPELDRGTVDALAEVFDYVFADQSIPVQMKYVIGRLQIPVLKAAMIDRDFFLSNDHPARRLVDTLAHASIAWAPEKGENDPLYTQIEQTVKRVLNEFEDDLVLFRDLLQNFTEFLFETEQQAQGRIEPAVNHESHGEAFDQALIHADETVHARINALPHAQPLAKFLLPFLTQQWRDVLVQAWLANASNPQRWDAALNTMDQLIWSTQPKTQSEERRQLVAVLPELVRSLNEGLDVIEWHGEPRATFTRRLITTHTLAIRMTQAPVVDTAAAALEEQAGQQAMQELDARLARQLSASSDEFDRIAHSFTRGLWFDFTRKSGKQHRCRLSWVSPMRTRLLFTNREGFDAFVRSEREVAALLRHNRLRVIDQTPIVGRALDHIMTSDLQPLAA